MSSRESKEFQSQASPLGATCLNQGVNFSIHSPEALGMDLLLFAQPDSPLPEQTLSLDPERNRSASFWHIFVPGLEHGQVYAWRATGPRLGKNGQRFDSDKILLDPYARAICGQEGYDRKAARATGENTLHALRSVVVDNSLYDWQGDQPLGPPSGREVIYEMHASGFTKSPSSGLAPELRGTYAGMIQKIPYLKELGITAVELLPVHQFDDQDAPEGRRNFWGYSTLGFFAPHAQFSSNRSSCGPVDEFRDLVKALHRAGIRLILDVVYNHTAEAGADGPTISFRGLDNAGYYLLKKDRSQYADFTGCGNTLNANGPVARRLILDSLRYWVSEMHVDGFRFDLASALTRDVDGSPLELPPLIEDINSDPVLANTTLIAEAWDAAGLYQVGSFPGDRFAEWNGPFRDHGRAFWRGDSNAIENLMGRLVGSPDLMGAEDEVPSHSINYITCHDGFCLKDLVSYSRKHNLDNGEDNRDGSDHNLSCNHGHEGPSDDPDIVSLRSRQVRNFLTLLFISHGTPMLLMGDEVGHTRDGNNNPWCQDNHLNWFDWNLVDQSSQLLVFVRQLINFTGDLPILGDDRFWSATSHEKEGDISWHGQKPDQPDWTSESQSLAFTLNQGPGRERIFVALNASVKNLPFSVVSASAGMSWVPVLDTTESFVPSEKAIPLGNDTITLAAKSMRIMVEKPVNS